MMFGSSSCLRVLQLTSVGHFMPYFGKEEESAHMLVLQWYCDSILSMRCVPTKWDVLRFFFELDSENMCLYK